MLAKEHGVSVETLDARWLDLAIDGADEIDGSLNLIKGLGGALVREKLVALRSRELFIVADESKCVTTLGERSALPVEAPSSASRSRVASNLRFPAATDVRGLARAIKQMAGVVDHGLFLGIAGRAWIAGPSGIREQRHARGEGDTSA